MKHLKTLGLAAVAAMALMAVAGAGTASATVLCKTAETTGCGASWDYPAGTTIDASLQPGTSAILEDTFGIHKHTCTESTIKSVTANTGSSTETIAGSVTAANLTFGGCTTTTDVINGGELEVHWISGTDNGTLTAKGFTITTVLAGETCVWTAGTGTDLGTLTGGPMAVFDINAVLTRHQGSGANCPSSVRWTANYTVTSPEPLYVSTS